ncbi:Uncharacterised protein [Leclercia adecarboxylata]|uniref:Uncharacterized protein n=1 Tax=Leclercia adecarboxylata TaxID=83655 RepID=A0A4U9HLZ1_9ENTR|nr:Uncharacterised protein [Leclercia adecarboxylata]
MANNYNPLPAIGDIIWCKISFNMRIWAIRGRKRVPD